MKQNQGIFYLIILYTTSFMLNAQSKHSFADNINKDYFYSSEIYWSSTTNDLILSGDNIIINFEKNNFKGKGTATFLTNEKNIFINGMPMKLDNKILVEGYKCSIKRISKETIQEKYKTTTSYKGLEIQFDTTLSKAVRDSTLVKGSFVWKDSSITGFPHKIVITSLIEPNISFTQKVDSLGRFEQYLTNGEYSFSPQLNYHWIGEEFIRIDGEKSAKRVDINTDLINEIKIQLDTINWPVNPQNVGILKELNVIDSIKIDNFMRQRMSFFEIPGASLSIIKNNKIMYTQEYGVSNINTKKAVTSETLFEAGSITKIVFAFAVMRLYERGIIDLDKPLYQYLPHEQIDDDRYKLITARNVLSHQTGMSNWPKKDENGKFKLNFVPGAKYGYSGKAYEYLKEVIESITSKSVEVILQEQVIKPLQIENMHFKANEEIKEYGANGHKNYLPSDIFLAKRTMVSYTLQTESNSLAKFALALYERKGLKKETYDEMFKVHSMRNDGTKWGLGVRIEDTKHGVSYGHSGSTGRGFISNLVFYDTSGLGYTILTNSQMGGFLALPLLNEYLILGKTNWK